MTEDTADFDDIFVECLKALHNAFRRLERQVPPPVPTQLPTGEALRYREKSIEQALLQKLARVVSGLHALRALGAVGLFQEQCVIQRTLDEIDEDIVFLAMPAVGGEFTEIHKRYLDEFWAEEFDQATAMASTQKRGMIPRQKVRAYIGRVEGVDDPSTAIEAIRTLHKTYSGWVHAASPQVMEMCGGPPPYPFHIAGMLGTPRVEEHSSDALNYLFRGICSARTVAKVFGDAELDAALVEYTTRFEKRSGLQGWPPEPEK